MVTLNFLPWRRLRLAYEYRVQMRMIFCAVIMAIFLISILHYFIEYKIACLHKEIVSIKNELSKLPALTKKPEFKLHQLDVEQANYNITINHILNFLTTTRAVNICFTAIDHTKNIFTFSGFTNSADDLLNFIKIWPAAKFFSEIQIKEFQEKNNKHMQFRFQAIKA